MPVFEHEGGAFAHFWLFYTFDLTTDDVRGLLSGGDDGLALGELLQEQADVGRFHDFQKLVGGIVLQSADGCGGVVKGDAFLGEEGDEPSLVEGFLAGDEEVLLVLEEEEAEDAPHVVLQVRVEEIHAPAFLLRRETSQHQQSGFGGEKGFKRMFFDGQETSAHEYGVKRDGELEKCEDVFMFPPSHIVWLLLFLWFRFLLGQENDVVNIFVDPWL